MRTMRLSIAILIILALLGFAFPIISHADTGSNQSQLISLLKQLIVVLEAQLQQIILQMQAQNVQPPANPPQTPEHPPQTPAATVTLAPAPTCTLTANPTSIIAGKSSTLTWTSSNATAASISPLGSTLLSSAQSVSPSYTTLYFGIFTGQGGRAVCSAIVGVTAAAATQNPVAGASGGTTASGGGTTGTPGTSCVGRGGTSYSNGTVVDVCLTNDGSCSLSVVANSYQCTNGAWICVDNTYMKCAPSNPNTSGSCFLAGVGPVASGVMRQSCVGSPDNIANLYTGTACSGTWYTCQNGQWGSPSNTTSGGSCPFGITVAGGTCAYTTTTSSCTTEGQQTYLRCPPYSQCLADPGWFTCRGGVWVR